MTVPYCGYTVYPVPIWGRSGRLRNQGAGRKCSALSRKATCVNNDNDIVCHILAAVNGLTFEAMFWLVVIIAVCEFCGLALLAIILRRLIVKTS